MIGIDLHLIHLQEGSQSFIFFLQNTICALSGKGKSTIDASSMKGKSTAKPFLRRKNVTGDSSMKGNSADLPKEGKKAETTSMPINFSRGKFRD